MGKDDLSEVRSTTRRRWWVWGSVVLGAVLLLGVGGLVLWATTTPEPGPDAAAALESDELVRVIQGDGYTFQPTEPARVGFVLYPGGRVDPASYAAPARAIAEAGFLVVVPELTLSLAVLDVNAADRVIADHPEIARWVIGGHSLGGAMAAQYAGDNVDDISGLVLWAAYPADSTDLSSMALDVASIFGTRDGLTTLDDIDESRSRLPIDAVFLAIEGGNHAQFGDYGAQDGDNPATISRAEQQAAVVEGSLQILRKD